MGEPTGRRYNAFIVRSCGPAESPSQIGQGAERITVVHLQSGTVIRAESSRAAIGWIQRQTLIPLTNPYTPAPEAAHSA